ncbi:MAG: hypothetical protein HRT82_02975 [Henriciella sp.]|nr:hypothetical protein [Henriciella sp.]
MISARYALAALIGLTIAPAGFAGCELDTGELKKLVGYEIEAVKTVAGWIDDGEGKVGNANDWEGCRYNRTIIFDDGTTVECSTYHHSSAWGPQDAVIFARYSERIICIDDELMDTR